MATLLGRLVAAQRTGQAAAKVPLDCLARLQLVVTLDTVKKHVGHVLGKLGAGNRTEAVTRARQLGLIP
jgi:hypothetical protein